jgi:hypothetical protein
MFWKKQIEAGGHKPERNLATEPKRPDLKQGSSGVELQEGLFQRCTLD